MRFGTASELNRSYCARAFFLNGKDQTKPMKQATEKPIHTSVVARCVGVGDVAKVKVAIATANISPKTKIKGISLILIF